MIAANNYPIVGTRVNVTYTKLDSDTPKRYRGLVLKYDQGKNGAYVVIETSKGPRSLLLSGVKGLGA